MIPIRSWMTNKTGRAEKEISHGRFLSEADTETLWGWGTPAGKLRAERRARLIADGGRLNPGTRVLEIGCGTGLFTEYFSKTGADITAVDISPELIEKAKSRGLPGTVKFVLSRFEDLNLAGGYDAVVGSSVLHHLDLKTALPKILKLLKPGGRMSFAEPNLRNPQVFLMFRFRSFFPEVSPDEDALLKGRIQKDLLKAGFKEIEITPFDWLHPSTPQRWIGHVTTLSNLMEKLPIVKEFAGSLHIRAQR